MGCGVRDIYSIGLSNRCDGYGSGEKEQWGRRLDMHFSETSVREMERQYIRYHDSLWGFGIRRG